MPNTNPQAIRVANEKMRPLADRFGQLYNLCKAYQAEATAEGWTAMFPANTEAIDDGADVDGRTIVTNQDIASFISVVSSFINYMDATSFANRNLTLKIAVNPERY